MKRKIITAILAITVVFSAASCGSAENKSSNTQEATVSDMQNSTERVSEAAGDTQSEEMTATVNDGENVPGSGTSKSDTSDAAASSSADSKNADSTVKKNRSDSKSSTKNSTSTAVNHNSTQSTGASTAKQTAVKRARSLQVHQIRPSRHQPQAAKVQTAHQAQRISQLLIPIHG